jgi:hypothetical protein
MNGSGKSDSPVVPAKPANNAARGKTAHTHAAAESVEGRGLAKGNTESAARSGHSAGIRAPQALDRVRQVVRGDRAVKDTREGDISRDHGRMLPSPRRRSTQGRSPVR